MGLVRKSNMEKYLSQDRVISTPFFGHYMCKNTFQLLLASIHMNDNSKYIPYGHQNHDPLFKIRPFHDMCKNRFKLVYSPECEFSFDERCCAYKGHLHFCLYNPQKPNKFHIKLFQVCTRTTKLVLGLLASVDLLHKGCHYYMDNYYSSPELSRNCMMLKLMHVALNGKTERACQLL